jgi:predicted HAD superfamily Cof-like phosphohydrolase
VNVDYVKRVRDAHRALGHTVGDSIAIRDVELRLSLIKEEAHEVVVAIDNGDLANLGGELSDLIYVLAGSAVSFGLHDITIPPARAPHGPPRIRQASLCRSAIMASVSEVIGAIEGSNLKAVEFSLARAIRAAEAVAALEGLELGPFFMAVHTANLAKASGVRRADGKWGKPPGWLPADLAGTLAEQHRQRGLPAKT